MRVLAEAGTLRGRNYVRHGSGGHWVAARRWPVLFESPQHMDIADAQEQDSDGKTTVDFPGPAGANVGPMELPAIGRKRRTASARSSNIDETEEYSSGRMIAVSIFAILLGFVGLCLFRFPLVSIVFGIGALLMGLRSLVASPKGDRTCVGFALAAIVISLAASGLGVTVTLKTEDPLGSVREMFGVTTLGDRHGELDEDEWIDASQDAIDLGGVKVSIGTVAITTLDRIDEFKSAVKNTSAAKKRVLAISVHLENNSEEDVLFARWSGAVYRNDDLLPSVMDDEGVEFAPVQIKGQFHQRTARVPMRSGQRVNDVLIFQPPAKFEKLRLWLPATSIGFADAIKFRIPGNIVDIAALSDPTGPPKAPAGGAKSRQEEVPPNPMKTVEIKKEPDSDTPDKSISNKASEEDAGPDESAEAPGKESSDDSGE